MNFDEIKTKRILERLGNRLPKNACNQSGGSLSDLGEKNASNQSGGTLGEGDVVVDYDIDANGNHHFKRIIAEGKKHETPKFIQHCVTAITEKPAAMARIARKKDGSPFGVCTAAYKRNKQSLAARHASGEHHSVRDYEGALKKLRQEAAELRASRPSRSRIVFEQLSEPKHQRSAVRFKPE